MTRDRDDDCDDHGHNGNGNGHHNHGNGNGNGHTSHGNGNGYGHDDDCDVPCFAAGTRLRMADGRSKLVDDIVPGDELMTTTGSAPVLWTGSSIDTDPVYEIMNDQAARMVVTKNHGVAVTLLDGSTALAPAKFLPGAQYADFIAREIGDGETKVYHIMLDQHAMVITYDGLVSESYFCGGYSTIPAAQNAYFAHTGRMEMDLVKPRVKRRDADEIDGLKAGRTPAYA